MSAIFTKGVETGGRGGKKDKLFHNNHRKHSPSDSPRGPRRPLCKLSPEAVSELGGEAGVGGEGHWYRTEPEYPGWEWFDL